MNTLVVAPHPDDEILGVGGTILKRKSQGNNIGWLIITKPNAFINWDDKKLKRRELEIKLISDFLKFDKVFKLDFEAGLLDNVPFGKLVSSISNVINEFKPDEIFIPHLGDVHTDHVFVHKALVSASKSFRKPFIKKLIVYETISETEYGLDRSRIFSPNLFVDITDFIDQKLEGSEIYLSEMGQSPFPRSKENILALARYRGSSAFMRYAEAFQILKFVE